MRATLFLTIWSATRLIGPLTFPQHLGSYTDKGRRVLSGLLYAFSIDQERKLRRVQQSNRDKSQCLRKYLCFHLKSKGYHSSWKILVKIMKKILAGRRFVRVGTWKKKIKSLDLHFYVFSNLKASSKKDIILKYSN